VAILVGEHELPRTWLFISQARVVRDVTATRLGTYNTKRPQDSFGRGSLAFVTRPTRVPESTPALAA